MTPHIYRKSSDRFGNKTGEKDKNCYNYLQKVLNSRNKNFPESLVLPVFPPLYTAKDSGRARKLTQKFSKN